MGNCKCKVSSNQQNIKEIVLSDMDEDMNINANDYEQTIPMPSLLPLLQTTQSNQDKEMYNGIVTEKDEVYMNMIFNDLNCQNTQIPSSLRLSQFIDKEEELYRDIIVSENEDDFKNMNNDGFDLNRIPSSNLLSNNEEEEFYNELVVSENDDDIHIDISEINKDKIAQMPISQPLSNRHNNEKELQSYITDYSNQYGGTLTSDHWLTKQCHSTLFIYINSCHLYQNNIDIGVGTYYDQTHHLTVHMDKNLVQTLKTDEEDEQLPIQSEQFIYNRDHSSFFRLSKIICETSSKDVIFKQAHSKIRLLTQIEQQLKFEKEGAVLYFCGNSSKEDGNLIFYDDLELQYEIFQISCEEIISLWDKRINKQKILLLLLDSQYTWKWIPKIKAKNDLTIFIQTIKGLDLQLLKTVKVEQQDFKCGEFSENIIKVLTNSNEKLINDKYLQPLFFSYNYPLYAYEVTGIPIFFFCFSQMVYFKDKMNTINYELDAPKSEINDPNRKLDGKKNCSEISFTDIFPEIIKYIGFINQDGIKSNFGSALYTNKDYYLGQWHQEQKSGIGIQQFETGLKKNYFGHFEQNLFQGEGLLINNNGSYYLGPFDQGKQNGNGYMYYSSGDSYHGNFLNDKRHGYGEEKMINGTTYKGQYLHDKKNGDGLIYNVEGIVIFTGKFLDGLKSGHGKEIYDREGKVFYEGDWELNLKNGRGKERYSNGAYFEGSFVDNVKFDIGKYIFSSGCVFQGKFNLDMRNGNGVYNDINNGLRYEGQWVNDQEEGFFKVYKDDIFHQQLFYLRGVPKVMRQKNRAALTIRDLGLLSPQMNSNSSSKNDKKQEKK